MCFFIEARKDTAGITFLDDTTDLSWNSPSDLTNPANGTYSWTPTYPRVLYDSTSIDHVGMIKYDKWKFCWTPSIAAFRANKRPYYFIVNAKDRMCPIPAKATYSFAITVNQVPDAIITIDSSKCNFYRFKYALTSATAGMQINHAYTKWFVETAPGSGQYIQKNPDANNNYTMSTNLLAGGNYNMYLRLAPTSGGSNDSIPFSFVVTDAVKVSIPNYSVCIAPSIKVKANSGVNQPDSNQYEFSAFASNIYSVVRPLSLDSFAILAVPNYGLYQYKLKVIDSLGCINEKYFTVNKKAPQQIVGRDNTLNIAIAGNTSQCVNNNSFIFSNTTSTSSPKYFFWKLHDGTIVKDTMGGVKQSYSIAGAKYVSLLVLTDSITCKADSNFVSVNINPLPNVLTNISGTFTRCNGDSLLLAPKNYDNANTYRWYYKNGNSPRIAYPINQANIYANQAGIYYLWVQNASTLCMDSSAVISISFNNKITSIITPSKPGPICNNQAIVLSAPANATYEWFNGNTLASTARTLSITQAGNYKLITHSGGCTDTSYYSATNTTFKINTNGNPTEYKCLNDSLLVFPSTLDTSNNYVWYFQDSLSARVAYPMNQTNIYMRAIGKYYLWAQNKNSFCIDSSSAINFIGPARVNSIITPSKLGVLCNYEFFTLSGPANSSYQWFINNSPLSTNRTINSNQLATFKLVVGSGVCYDTSTFTPVYNTVDIVDNPDYYSYCAKTKVLVSIRPIANAQSYSWYLSKTLVKTGLDTFISLIAPTSTLKVLATNINNCKDSLDISLQTLPTIQAQIGILGDTLSCIGQKVNLYFPDLSLVKYYFQKNNRHFDSTSNNINITQNGNYRLILKTISSGCQDTSRTVPVLFNSKPIVSVLPKDTALFCAGSSVMLSANGTASNYQWKLNNQNIAGANANAYQAAQAGVYTVVNKTGQCADSASLLAIEIPLPTKPNINTFGDTMTSTTTATQYQWYKNGNAIAGANAQSYVGLQNGLYRVKVSNSFGCSDSSMDYTFTKSGIIELGREDIKLYPNPTSNYALLELANIATWQVQINDVSGKTLRSYKPFKGKELMIQKDELKAGAYLVQIKNMDSHKTGTLKLIIE